jgi:hypothetical protein
MKKTTFHSSPQSFYHLFFALLFHKLLRLEIWGQLHFIRVGFWLCFENGHTVTLPNDYQGQTKKLDLRGGLKQGVGSGVRIGN